MHLSVGLQDIGSCTFEDPHFCNYQSNYTMESGYQWKRHYGSTSTPGTGPSTDADGKIAGITCHLYYEGFWLKK